ncbi:hypothetical protein K0M31_009185 [Melipona bicolor]|uniref:Uncharacterized protein n=1 Tax=Melipona bicolor TaxID=60889 RepID=A0AA40FP22_9HYME|nr:hypothetical protein K0M31_009185 [Melipona bicolor]
MATGVPLKGREKKSQKGYCTGLYAGLRIDGWMMSHLRHTRAEPATRWFSGFAPMSPHVARRVKKETSRFGDSRAQMDHTGNKRHNGTTNLSGRQSPWAVSSSASIIAPAYPSSHGNFLKNIPSLKGEKSTALETDRGPQRGGGQGWRSKRVERTEYRGKRKGRKRDETGRKEDNGGRWRKQWSTPATLAATVAAGSHPTDTTELLDKL